MLIGDSLGDLHMAEGIPNPNVILKIGFPIKNTKRISSYIRKVHIWSGLVCVVLHRALWAHVGDFGVALCRCALNHVSLFFFFSIMPASGNKTSIFFFFPQFC